jgi:NAD(P)-dependent dehydrogenase (short-subunit alcohol dehydrogenase family)
MRVLVTGGAKRLGRVLSLAIAEAGGDVCVHYNRSKTEAEALALELRKYPVRVAIVCADLSNPEAVDGLIQESAKLLGGPLTALVNNASTFENDGPKAVKRSVLNEALAVNLVAPMILSQRFFEQASKGSDNLIVDLLDQKLWNMNPDFYSYTVSKAALHSTLEMRAMAFSPSVRVCGIAPGLLFPSFDQTPSEFAATASKNLNQKPIAPEDVGRALLTLVQNTALNGQVLHVDNGQRLCKLSRDVIFAHRHREGSQ